MNLVIKTKDLSKKYKDNHGLLPTNFELHKGEVCALIGRNGCILYTSPSPRD